MPVSALQRALLQGLLQSNFSHLIIMSARKKMSLFSLHRIYNSSAWRICNYFFLEVGHGHFEDN
jgi:hypothetical protein